MKILRVPHQTKSIPGPFFTISSALPLASQAIHGYRLPMAVHGSGRSSLPTQISFLDTYYDSTAHISLLCFLSSVTWTWEPGAPSPHPPWLLSWTLQTLYHRLSFLGLGCQLSFTAGPDISSNCSHERFCPPPYISS